MADANPKREIVPRKEAIGRGLRHYFSGTSCCRGHISERFTSGSTCCECAKIYYTRYYAKIRKPKRVSPRDAAKAKGLIYYYGRKCPHGHDGQRFVKGRHCVECAREQGRRYSQSEFGREKKRSAERRRYALDPVRHINKVKKQYRKNAEYFRAKQRARHREKYLNEEVRLAAQERTRKWAIENPERASRNARVSNNRRRVRELGADGFFTAEQLVDLFEKQKGKCAYCRKSIRKKYHADHIVPLALGGSNWISNIALACPGCNLAKAARDPIDHARSLGMLL